MENLSTNQYGFILVFLVLAACDSNDKSDTTTDPVSEGSTPSKKNTKPPIPIEPIPTNNTVNNKSDTTKPSISVTSPTTPPMSGGTPQTTGTVSRLAELKENDLKIQALKKENKLLSSKISDLWDKKFSPANKIPNLIENNFDMRILIYTLTQKQKEKYYLKIEKKLMRAAKKDDDGAAAIEKIKLYKKELTSSPELISYFRDITEYLLIGHPYYMYKHPKVKHYLESCGAKPQLVEFSDILSALEGNNVNVDEAIITLGSRFGEKSEGKPWVRPESVGILDKINTILDKFKNKILNHLELKEYLNEVKRFYVQEETRVVDDYATYIKQDPKLLEPLLDIVGPDRYDIRYITLEHYLDALKDRPARDAEYVSKKLQDINLAEYESNKLREILELHKVFIKKHPEFLKKIKDLEKERQTTVASILSQHESYNLEIQKLTDKYNELSKRLDKLNKERKNNEHEIEWTYSDDRLFDLKIKDFKEKHNEFSNEIKALDVEFKELSGKISLLKERIASMSELKTDFIKKETEALEKENSNNQYSSVVSYRSIERKFMIAAKTKDDGAAAIEVLQKHEKKLKQSRNAISYLLERHKYYMYKKPRVSDYLKGLKKDLGVDYFYFEALEKKYPDIAKTPSDILLAIDQNNVDEVIRAIGKHAAVARDSIKIILEQHAKYIEHHLKLRQYLDKIGFAQDEEQKAIARYTALIKAHPKLLEPLLEVVGPSRDEIKYITLKYYLKALKSKDSSPSDYVTQKLKAIKFNEYEDKQLQEILKPHEEFIKKHLKSSELPKGYEIFLLLDRL